MDEADEPGEVASAERGDISVLARRLPAWPIAASAVGLIVALLVATPGQITSSTSPADSADHHGGPRVHGWRNSDMAALQWPHDLPHLGYQGVDPPPANQNRTLPNDDRPVAVAPLPTTIVSRHQASLPSAAPAPILTFTPPVALAAPPNPIAPESAPPTVAEPPSSAAPTSVAVPAMPSAPPSVDVGRPAASPAQVAPARKPRVAVNDTPAPNRRASRVSRPRAAAAKAETDPPPRWSESFFDTPKH